MLPCIAPPLWLVVAHPSRPIGGSGVTGGGTTHIYIYIYRIYIYIDLIFTYVVLHVHKFYGSFLKMRFCIRFHCFEVFNAEVMTCLSSCLISNELDWGHSAPWLFHASRKGDHHHHHRHSHHHHHPHYAFRIFIVIAMVILAITGTMPRQDPHNELWLMTIIIIVITSSTTTAIAPQLFSCRIF